MKNNSSYGLPAQSASRAARVGNDADDLKRTINIFKDGEGGNYTTFFLIDILMNELCGEFFFETENEDLMRQEVVFWNNLVWMGRVGIYNLKGRPLVVNINDVTYNPFKEPTKIGIRPARINIDYQSSEKTKDDRVIYVDPKKVTILLRDVSSMPFLIKYMPMIKRMQKIMEQKLDADIIRNKIGFFYQNTKNDKFFKQFWNQFKKGNAIDKIESPVVNAGMDIERMDDEKFQFENYNFPKEFLISLEDVMKQWKFDKDLIGMEENSSQKKERVQSMEIEDNKSNTIQMQQIKISLQKTFLEKFKEIFPEIKLEIKGTCEEKIDVEESEQAFNDKDGGENENQNENL